MRTDQLFERYEAKFAVPPPPAARFTSAAAEAAAYGRRVGYEHWLAALKDRGAPESAPCTDMGGRPAGGPPLQHAADCALGADVHHRDPGRSRGSTPLSMRGPGCSGNLVAFCTAEVSPKGVARLVALRGGRAALHFHPLSPWDKDRLPLRGSEEWRRLMREGPCPVCAARVGRNLAPTLSDWHIINECLATWDQQAAAQEAAPALVRDIARATIVARHRGRRPREDDTPEPPGVDEDANSLLALAQDVDWLSHDGQRLLYHLTTALTWSASDVGPAPHNHHHHHPQPAAEGQPNAARELLSSLGRLFDSTNVAPRYVHPVANRWVPSAVRTTGRFLKAWQNAAADIPPIL